MIRPLHLLLLTVPLLTAGCAETLDRLPFVYRQDVRQGMVLKQEMVDQLRAGMTRRQVQYIMGSPPVTDTFHPDRWDYVEAVKPGGEPMRQKRVTVFFEGDRLVGVSGDLAPADPALRRAG